jgi:hypothetical protein
MSVEPKSKSQEVDLIRNLDFVEGFGKYETSQSNIKGELLKFIKGVWYAGPDQKKIELGTRMIVNGDSMMLGWQLWADERVVDFVMGELVKGFQPPKREELSFPPGPNGKNAEWPLDDNGNPADPWRYAIQVLMRDEDGQLYTFSIGSKGGRSALGLLMLEWSQKCREGAEVYPVVELGADTYKHKKYSLIDIPLLEIVDWLPIKDFGGDAEEVKPAAKAKVTKPAATKPVTTAKGKSGNGSRGRQVGY